MKIFLDANIIISVLNKEYPLFTFSARILSLADRKGVEMFTSPLCLGIAFYFAEKKCGAALGKQKISLLADKIKITSINADTVNLALSNKKIKDFEDVMEYYSAINSRCDCIITEDTNDFYFSDTEVLNCKAFCLKYMIRKK